jgi:predicted metal-dependent hydrolase
VKIDMQQLRLENIIIDVERKKIKHIYLTVSPPEGRVHISAPLRMSMGDIQVYTLSKLNWIKKQQARFGSQAGKSPKEFLNNESHYYNGKCYLLEVIEVSAPPKVELSQNTLILSVRPDTPTEKRQSIMDKWYRVQLKTALPALIEKWEKALHVQVNEFGVRKMRTRWGTCNRAAKRIWLNLELAQKSPECLEYIVVHEMVHLLERKHNKRFTAFMNEYLPDWRHYKDELNGITRQT